MAIHGGRGALVIFTACLLIGGVWCDFVYRDFNDTTGLMMVGSTRTSTCNDGNYRWDYQPSHGKADPIDHGGDSTTVQSESTTHMASQSRITDQFNSSTNISTHTAIFGHRDHFQPSHDLVEGTCVKRMRLTGSQPFQQGSVWRQQPVPVYSGWETSFQFQITDHARSCTIVKDRAFSTRHHESCMVHGGDGFAFVMHLDNNETLSLGKGGEGMGYAGIKNGIAVEFDTWYNPDLGDLLVDHVSIQSLGEAPLSVGEDARLSTIKNTSLADGNYHIARIQYFPYLKYDLLSSFTGSTHLQKYLRDNGEGRRIGTLVVYVDDMDTPLMAIPINLSTVLRLPEGMAYVGFTSATGRTYEKHDITAWYFCEQVNCPNTNREDTWVHGNNFRQFIDYHSQDNTEG